MCLQGDNQLRWVIAANEEMARFMILADAFLADKDKVRQLSQEEQQEQQLCVSDDLSVSVCVCTGGLIHGACFRSPPAASCIHP